MFYFSKGQFECLLHENLPVLKDYNDVEALRFRRASFALVCKFVKIIDT